MLLGTVSLVIIPFPQKGDGIVFVDVIRVVKMVRFRSSFEDISMKLGGHIGHGPNSSYHHF